MEQRRAARSRAVDESGRGGMPGTANCAPSANQEGKMDGIGAHSAQAQLPRRASTGHAVLLSLQVALPADIVHPSVR